MVEYKISKQSRLRKMSGPRAIVQQLIWPSDKKFWETLIANHNNSSEGCILFSLCQYVLHLDPTTAPEWKTSDVLGTLKEIQVFWA